MAGGSLRDPNIGEFAQMAVFSFALAVTMFIFAVREHGFSTHFLGYAGGGVFLLLTGFFGYVTRGLMKPSRVDPPAPAAGGPPAGR